MPRRSKAGRGRGSDEQKGSDVAGSSSIGTRAQASGLVGRVEALHIGAEAANIPQQPQPRGPAVPQPGGPFSGRPRGPAPVANIQQYGEEQVRGLPPPLQFGNYQQLQPPQYRVVHPQQNPQHRGPQQQYRGPHPQQQYGQQHYRGPPPVEAGTQTQPPVPHMPSPPPPGTPPVAQLASPRGLVPPVSAHVVPRPSSATVPTSSRAIVPVPRPDKGTIGKPVRVRVNHYKIGFNVQTTVFHYDVAIFPAIGSKPVCRELQQELVTRYASDLGNRLPVYDGKANLFTAGPLPFERKVFEVSIPGQNKKYRVTLKLASRLDGTELDMFLRSRQSHIPQTFIQALDVALREWPSRRDYVPSGRSFFDKSFGQCPLDNGHEAWKGFYQSLRPTMQGLSLNIDISATAFYEPIGVVQFLQKALGIDPNRPLRDSDKKKAGKLLCKLKVQVTHRNSPRRYRIAALSPGPTKGLTFPLEDGQHMKVADYFLDTYSYAIRYPELPCLQVQAKQISYLPMEVCTICPGQKYTGKLNERQTTNMLRFTCQIPSDRERAISGVIQSVHSANGNVYAKEFGMTIDPRPTVVDARILPPPKLRYSNGSSIEPRRGEWNMLQSKFVQPATINVWGLINFSGAREGDVQYFAADLVKRCNDIGMKVQPLALRIRNGWIQNFQQLVKQVIQEAGKIPELIVCIMDKKEAMYGELKRVCETEIGVVTQCCLRKHIATDQKKLSQYLANLAMKINVKVGGQNVTLHEELPRMLPQVLNAPTIIFGADVSHPSAGDLSSPSLAAVVASVDWPTATKYLPRVRTQTHRVEKIEALGEMVSELMREFRMSTGMVPHKILFFRDGVSEGQFDEVLQYEVPAIFQACHNLEAGYHPKLTFVVVQKRHHTRFFPTDNNVEKNNVIPGTVVDSVITHPSQFDFFLCSHKGLQGTSRPAHYHVLYDENKFRADDLQRLVNNLCYTYARCTKAVSIVPPAFYAHLLAYRARLYLEDSSDSASVVSGGSAPKMRPVTELVRKVMFYC